MDETLARLLAQATKTEPGISERAERRRWLARLAALGPLDDTKRPYRAPALRRIACDGCARWYWEPCRNPVACGDCTGCLMAGRGSATIPVTITTPVAATRGPASAVEAKNDKEGHRITAIRARRDAAGA